MANMLELAKKLGTVRSGLAGSGVGGTRETAGGAGVAVSGDAGAGESADVVGRKENGSAAIGGSSATLAPADDWAAGVVGAASGGYTNIWHGAYTARDREHKPWRM